MLLTNPLFNNIVLKNIQNLSHINQKQKQKSLISTNINEHKKFLEVG